MGAPSAPDGLDELRYLLVAPEREELRSLKARLDDPDLRARDLVTGLPDALAHLSGDRRLSEALMPSIETVITGSVRRNPKPLADALFPVIGPAIRRAVAHTLGTMLDSLNRTVEQSLSLKALRWRLVAWRTGRPFAEVVLLNTLVFRVEQVFLIHARTGLLLQHVAAESVAAQDADMVSGMLTAIRDFARDSFGGRADDTLDTFRVGDLSGHVEHGPQAYIAVIVRGTAPPDLRRTLQHAIETIHLQQIADLEAFDGDASRFDDARPVLQECLESRYRTAEARPTGRRRWAAAAIAGAALLAVWLGVRWVENRRFAAYVTALNAVPGLIVVDAQREGGRFVVRGLRDPLAADPQSFLASAGLSADRVDGRWQLYQAVDPGLALARARHVLEPPDGVELELQGATLVASGEASPAWIRDATLLARTLPAIRAFDPSGLQNAELRSASRRLEASMVSFVRGTPELVPGQEPQLAAMVDELRVLDAGARSAGVRFRVIVTGHTDADGSADRNLALSRDRADAVVAALPTGELGSLRFESRGAGSSEPLSTGTTDADKQRNRRVAVRIEPLAGSSQP
jgi:outer membrane protein OmpA-like peptidoglycan-associated protein